MVDASVEAAGEAVIVAGDATAGEEALAAGGPTEGALVAGEATEGALAAGGCDGGSG